MKKIGMMSLALLLAMFPIKSSIKIISSADQKLSSNKSIIAQTTTGTNTTGTGTGTGTNTTNNGTNNNGTGTDGTLDTDTDTDLDDDNNDEDTDVTDANDNNGLSALSYAGLGALVGGFIMYFVGSATRGSRTANRT
jgi:hypothetical protein